MSTLPPHHPSPDFETTHHCNLLPNSTSMLYTRRAMATSPTARGIRRKITLPLPRHPGNTLLLPRTARRPRYTNGMGRAGETHLPTTTLPLMVDATPSANNGSSIFSLIESAYLHCDSLCYGWRTTLNEQSEARAFCHRQINNNTSLGRS
jgi:hypothetical protein